MMVSRLSFTVFLAGAALAGPAGPPLIAPVAAQSVLTQLGLTETQARTFLFDELKGPTVGANRRTPIAVAGHRAFYRLPAPARGPAATALFAWAKAYVNSPTFKAAYAEFRRAANPIDNRASPSVDEQVAAQIAEMQAGIEETRKMAATLPPADRERLLAMIKEQEAQMSQFRDRLRSALELEQAERRSSNEQSASEFTQQFPADLNQLVARRLRMFLAETADADFNARIIRLTDGPDGMEFIEPAHRAKSSTWQLAVLAGPEATKAARAAAEAWLKEVAP